MSTTNKKRQGIRAGRRGIFRRPALVRGGHKTYEEPTPFLRYRGRFYDRSDLEFMAERIGIDFPARPYKGEVPDRWPLNPTRIVDRYYAQGGELEGAPLS